MKTRLLSFALAFFLQSTILYSQQWISVGENVLPDNFYTWALSAVDEHTVFALCDTEDYSEQRLVRTTDGGITWDVVDLSIMPGFPQDIHAISADTIWIVYRESSGTARLYLSTDAGQTLEEKHSHQGNFVIGPALQFGDETSGYIIDPSVITASFTNNGGATWQSNNMVPFTAGETWGMANPTNWMDAKGNTIWWGTSKFIHRSTDNGATWESFDNGFSDGAETKCISFSQCGLGMAASNSTLAGILGETHISTSSDGGATWTELPILDLPLEGLTDVPGLNGAFVGVGGIFKDFVPGLTHQYVSAYTLDGGLNWTVMGDFPLNAVEFVSPVAGWAGTILSHDYGGNPVLFKWSGPLPSKKLFVNGDANGLNNGSSWDDAFTDLQTALTAAEEGDQIWVAEGTYLPGTDPTATFLIDKNLKLYGGFAGTECSLSERDIVLHPTILSGDVNVDDVPDDFVTNREDNVMTVMTVTAAVTNETVVDGFTIRNGHADGVNNNQERRGGGIYSLGAPVVMNCFFTQNYVLQTGGGLFLFGEPSIGTEVENCRFEKNRADVGGAGIYALNVQGEGVTVRQSTFDSNQGGRGSGLRSFDSNIKVIASTLSNNTNIEQGGGLWFWCENFQNLSLVVDSCTFENNQSSFGGGLYFVSSGTQSQNCSMSITNSTFKNNAAVPNNLPGWDQGGGGICIYVDDNLNNTQLNIGNCLFSGNSSTQKGAGLEYYNVGTATNFQITNCEFLENESDQDGGGFTMWEDPLSQDAVLKLDNCSFSNNTSVENGSAFWARLAGKNTGLELNNCNFTENTATNLSAAADVWGTAGGTGSVVVDSCFFENNTSGYSGALEMGNGHNGGASLDFTLTNSTFLGNQAMEGGAAILWSDALSTSNFTVENCHWEGNSASLKGGALMFNPNSNNYSAIVKRSTFLNNQSPDGSAINSYISLTSGSAFPTNADVSIENSLFSGNTGNNAAISAEHLPNLHILNCTIADNDGNGIELSDQSSLTLQNTILANPGFTEYTAATGDVTVTSLGGNLISDNSLADHALAYDHQEVADPGFVGGGDYRLHSTSFAIDKGVDLGNLPATDLDGNDRRYMDGCVDIGAYESEIIISGSCVTSVREILIGEISLSPNPATDLLYLALTDIATPTDLAVFDAQGRLVLSQKFTAGEALRVGHLPDGVFMVKVTDGERVYVGRFVKQ